MPELESKLLPVIATAPLRAISLSAFAIATMSVYTWTLPFFGQSHDLQQHPRKAALIILNQPFSVPLLQRLWNASQWHCCADGGAKRLLDALKSSTASQEIDLRTT